MRTRFLIGIRGIAAFLLSVVVCASVRAEQMNDRFSDPLRGIEMRLPRGARVVYGLGRTLAYVTLPDGVVVHVRADDSDRANTMGISLLCDGGVERRMEAYLACRDLRTRVRKHEVRWERDGDANQVLPLQAPSPAGLADSRRRTVRTLSLALERAQQRALFALLDGRAGCPGVADEVRLAMVLADRHGLAPWRDRFAALADVLERRPAPDAFGLLDDRSAPPSAQALDRGLALMDAELGRLVRARLLERAERPEAARRLYERAARARAGFFARVALMRMDQDAGRLDEARHRLDELRQECARAGIASAMVDALGGGDLPERCGAAGAMADLREGVALIGADPHQAVVLLRRAVSVDPAFLLAYRALGQALLEAGGEVDAVCRELRTLLQHAPKTDAVQRLRAEIDRLG